MGDLIACGSTMGTVLASRISSQGHQKRLLVSYEAYRKLYFAISPPIEAYSIKSNPYWSLKDHLH